jgi:hypothetical protein
MSDFSPEWLALREPYDLRARNAGVLAAVSAAFAERHAVAVVDLACGTGATLRAISARLPPQQHWLLVDNDLGLFARASLPPQRRRVIATKPIDLARDLEAALDGPIDLVTMSALLDLVSATWIGRLAVETAARRLPVYAALTYDGRVALDPPDPLDAAVIAAVNEHQRRDKGFGPALGPKAAGEAIARFTALGATVVQGHADWVLGRDDRVIQEAILAGWAAAAGETGSLEPAALAAWLSRRRAHVVGGRSRLSVGHVDFFACPTGRR